MKDNGMEELLSLKWNNHRSTFLHILAVLRDKQLYTDATLACDGKLYSVHKLVLSTCSDYFSSMLDRTSCKNPVIVLKDIKSDDLEALLDYMYLGEVNVRQSDLSTLIKAAECLRVKGLAVADDEPPPKKSKPENQSRKNDSVSSSPPSKRKRRSDVVEDGRDDVRPPRAEHRQVSPISSRPKSPTGGTFISSTSSISKPNSSSARNSLEEITQPPSKIPTSNSSDNNNVDFEDPGPCIKVEMSDDTNHPPDDDSNLEGNPGDIGENLSDSYGMGSDDFKEENDPDGGDLNNDLPEFLQQASAGYQHSSFGGPSFQTDLSWQSNEDNGNNSFGGSSSQYTGSQDASSQGPAGTSSSYFLPHTVLDNTSKEVRMDNSCVESITQAELSRFNLAYGFGSASSRTEESGYPPEQSSAIPLPRLSLEIKSPSCSVNSGAEPFPCPSCTKTFGRLWHLKRHMATHLAVRPFECPFCGYRVNFKDKLKLHILKAHPDLPAPDLRNMDAPFTIAKSKTSSFDEE